MSLTVDCGECMFAVLLVYLTCSIFFVIYRKKGIYSDKMSPPSKKRGRNPVSAELTS
jgi:amino acid transporter